MVMQDVGAFAAALAIGLSLGLIGAGGSILTIPVFVYLLKIDPLSSGVYSMFVVGISSFVGGVQSIINGLVDLKASILFGIPSIAGVLIATKFLPPELFCIRSFNVSKQKVFMLCLTTLMFVAAVRMLNPLDTDDQKSIAKNASLVILSSQGFMVGIITGLLGIGGGFLIVPALFFWTGLPVKKSIGTTLIITCSNCIFSFWSSYASMQFDWPLLMKFSSIAIVGILVGTRVSFKIQSGYLKKAFGCFILWVSFYVVYKTLVPVPPHLLS
jgi:uncharacterized membrane protein YfcA